MTALPVISLVEEVVRDGSVPLDVDAAARVVFLLPALVAGRIAHPRFHLRYAATALIFCCVYIATLFTQLR